jgi:adenosylmethionine-8-amino-7-oxononanoate aminotransferase
MLRAMSTRDSRFWHPFADMGAVRGAELVIERGEDVWVWDAAGTRYFDATAALWYMNVGHGRSEIADAAAAQMRKLAAYTCFGDLAVAPAVELCERLAGHAPMEDARVFLTSGGGDSVETALKIARRYWFETGSPQRTHVISRTSGYHGTHGFGTAIAGIPANRHGFGPLLEDVTVVPHDSAEALADAFARIGPERVAAFFLEPVIGAGGVFPPVEGYVEAVAELCRESGVLLVVDSVICGFGRLGTWFGIERWPGVEPDLVTFAKGVTSGYLPLGGVLASGRVAEPFFAGPGAPVLRHGATYAGHASCCAAALANLDLMERENLIPRGRELEGDLLAAMTAAAEHPLAAGARGGTGLMAALELAPEAVQADPAAAAKLALGARRHGVIVRPLVSAVVVSPALTATREHFTLLSDALTAALDELQSALVLAR